MANGTEPETGGTRTLLEQCISVDLEVDPTSNRIRSFAGVRPGRTSFEFRGGDLDLALKTLDDYAAPADFLLGHNMMAFDVQHLAATSPDLRLLAKPIIDTLWLNPLAFPRNPYHHLVKHYQDGRLQAGHVSDPEQDARLVLTVLANQIEALAAINAATPEVTRAYHFLTTRRDDHAGFGAVFDLVRGAEVPAPSEAQAVIRGLLAGTACTHQVETVIPEAARDGWPLAYALAWISVAGGDSVMPPWVRHQFPEASRLVRRLRDGRHGQIKSAGVI